MSRHSCVSWDRKEHEEEKSRTRYRDHRALEPCELIEGLGTAAKLTIVVQYFFYPRQMEISLFQGDYPQSAPSRASSRASSRVSSTSSSDSSSDSSDSEDHAANGNKRERRDARRREKRERKAERKTEKRERKVERRREKALRREQRRDQKAVRNERWQLVVSYKPPTLMPPPPQSF